MTSAPPTVLLLHTRTQLSRAVESDLSSGGFDVVPVMEWRAFIDAARRRSPAAVVVPELMPRVVWRAWRTDRALSRVPLVSLWSGRPVAVWPLAMLVRAGATVTAEDLKHPGSAVDAVRASIGVETDAAPTRRESMGEAMWQAASILRVVSFVTFFAFLASPFLAMPRMLWLVVAAVLGLAATDVLEAVGAALAFRRRPKLRWATWFSIAFGLLGLVLVIAGRCPR